MLLLLKIKYHFFASGIANISQRTPSEPHRLQPHGCFTKKKEANSSVFLRKTNQGSEEMQIVNSSECCKTVEFTNNHTFFS